MVIASSVCNGCPAGVTLKPLANNPGVLFAMVSSPPVLLMTRPQPAGRHFADTLAPGLRAGLTVCLSPLIGIAPRRDPVEIGDARGLIFTSANGVRAAAGLIGGRDLPSYCVGDATAQAARAAGWDKAQATGADADALVAALLRDPPPGPLLHLRGAHARGDAAGRLAAGGLPARAVTVYDQPALTLTDAARAHLAGRAPVLVPLFSPRSARLFAAQHGGAAPLYLQAMSPAVAAELRGLPAEALEIAEAPTGAAMRLLVERRLTGLRRVEGDRGPQ